LLALRDQALVSFCDAHTLNQTAVGTEQALDVVLMIDLAVPQSPVQRIQEEAPLRAAPGYKAMGW